MGVGDGLTVYLRRKERSSEISLTHQDSLSYSYTPFWSVSSQSNDIFKGLEVRMVLDVYASIKLAGTFLK